ncbi:MAG: hypothetical protein KatS3mg002_1686 [Candidatus Woesearchaeota archaeon]|nr:MAG: hypothetical protein KatS3mg002_1686 [Candidatus Woesearchaeota archaeon]GIX40446.1 MAG: hypothetical protein KatS3mg129_0179 [Leptospiraceae bacterium]
MQEMGIYIFIYIWNRLLPIKKLNLQVYLGLIVLDVLKEFRGLLFASLHPQGVIAYPYLFF